MVLTRGNHIHDGLSIVQSGVVEHMDWMVLALFLTARINLEQNHFSRVPQQAFAFYWNSKQYIAPVKTWSSSSLSMTCMDFLLKVGSNPDFNSKALRSSHWSNEARYDNDNDLRKQFQWNLTAGSSDWFSQISHLVLHVYSWKKWIFALVQIVQCK